MSKPRVSLEVARACAKLNATGLPGGWWRCDGCGQQFWRGRINTHVYAARRRVSEADAVVRP